MNLYQAAMLLNHIVDSRQFKKNDNSLLDRVNKIYNQIKHFDSNVNQTRNKETSSFKIFVDCQNASSSFGKEELGDHSTTALWITNSGIECKVAKISFAELASQIEEFYTEAESIATYDMGKHIAPDRRP